MITFKKISLRSLEENAYYWGVVIAAICTFTGWTRDDAHEWVKKTWQIKSTATLTTEHFEKLMENIREHCLKFWDLYINLPNQ